ncbi:MAG: hypothetical protein ABJB86_04370 [Bacteroidota bacterium]
MFNSPILDVAIGLVFIFLLYSLLATSIKEAIATAFAFRARMLKTAITEKMLTCKDKETAKSRWASIWKGIYEFLQQTLFIFTGNLKERENNLGTWFYDHPIIKGYGASRVFPNPSYIPKTDFSTIVIEILKKDFTNKLKDIATYKLGQDKNGYSIDDVIKDLQLSGDGTKIKALLDYYTYHFTVFQQPPPSFVIDKETLYLLQMQLQKSIYNVDAFAKQLENWFDQTMNRVSGWYKRQVQVILFFIGLTMAIIFNVDVLQIANKLTTDKDARDKIVQLAIREADQYKDDPRVKKTTDRNGNAVGEQTDSNNAIFQQYQDKLNNVKKELSGNIDTANNMLAIGWGDFGKKTDSSSITNSTTYGSELALLTGSELAKKKKEKTNAIFTRADSADAGDKALAQLYINHPVKLKIGYVLAESFHGKKLLGFIILAFAVCLGAPFWFDLLNKLINLRATGKKEQNSNDAPGKNDASQQQPLTVNVNSQQTGTEAVG